MARIGTISKWGIWGLELGWGSLGTARIRSKVEGFLQRHLLELGFCEF